MNTTAIYHRPESEFAYLFEKTKCTFGCAQLVKMCVTCNYYAGIRIPYTKKLGTNEGSKWIKSCLRTCMIIGK